MFLEKIIKKIKRDPTYKWENNYTIRDLSVILFSRSKQVIRGLRRKIYFNKSKGLTFIGCNVKIMHSSKLYSGRNFIVGDGTYINGLSEEGITVGDDVSIGRNATIICTGVIAQIGVGIKIGSGTGINDFAYIGGQGGIEIGENVIIGPGVKIFSENHVFHNEHILIKKQGVSRQGVKIGNNCWIGANAVILDGVVIGDGVVVAAGSIVNKSFPNDKVVGGIPAKILKDRIK